MSKISTDILQTSSQASKELDKAKNLANQQLKSEKEVDKAAAGFEALLLHQMLKSMWATVEFTGFLGGDSNASQIYRDMLNQAVADSVAEGRGIGVKDFLKKELLRLAEPHPNREISAENTDKFSDIREVEAEEGKHFKFNPVVDDSDVDKRLAVGLQHHGVDEHED